ncbi:MAG: diguanylate cyclase [Thermoanaerobaculaceae bacterium]
MRARMVTLAVALLAVAAAAGGQDSPPLVVERLPTSLEGEWLFRVGHDPAFASPFRERRNWQRIHVPGPWQRQGWRGYNGHAWYRLSLVISSDLAGQDLGLDLGRVSDVDEVFLNGRRIGSTGSFPPHFDKATLARRFYLIPREVLRLGQLNELSVHVYNDSSFGGLLGPPPELDIYQALLRRQVLRDVGAYCVSTVLFTLAVMHLLLFAKQRDLFEHLSFAGSTAALGVFMLTYTTWGPSLILGYSTTYRLAIASMMAGVAMFPSVPLRLARRTQPVAFLGVETMLALGAAFALAWRDVADLQLWLYAAQAALLLVAGLTLKIEISLVGRRPWALPALITSSLLAVAITLDILVDIGVLPRARVLGGELYAPLLAVPFAVCLSFALALSWMQRRWGEPLDAATGLMSRERFTDRLGAELLRARRGGSPLAVALLRLTLVEPASERDQPTTEAVASLRRGLRQIDLLARYDAETFALLLSETDERAAMSIIERLRRTASQSVSGRSGRARTTAGLAQYRPGRHLSADELLREAEAALYAAVSEGGDCTATAP